MSIKDYTWRDDIEKRNNNPLLPSNIRGLIIGKSNCGKTILLMNLLLEPTWLDYDHLFVFGKSLHQTEYQILKKGFELGYSKAQIKNLFENQKSLKEVDVTPIEALCEYTGKREGGIVASFYEDSCDQIPDPRGLNSKDKNLLILDDCFLGKQNTTEAYYTRGRHNNCDTIYISQNYFRLPRQTIRENSNLIILFPQDTKNLHHIHADHCNDISIDEFKSLCKHIWTEKKYNFVTIDLTSSIMNGKYRKNFNWFYFPNVIRESNI